MARVQYFCRLVGPCFLIGFLGKMHRGSSFQVPDDGSRSRGFESLGDACAYGVPVDLPEPPAGTLS